MDVHEMLAVVVSSRQDTGKPEGSLSASSTPFSIPSASPLAIPNSESGHLATAFSLPLGSLQRMGSLFSSSSSRSSTMGRHSAEFSHHSQGGVASLSGTRTKDQGPPKLARASTGFNCISRGMADFEPMFHMDTDRFNS